jgi:hypothetical protein
MLSSILSFILVAIHGFSWLLGGPSGGYLGRGARDVPEATWLGISLAQVSHPASFQLGPREDSPTTHGSTSVSALGPTGCLQAALLLLWPI